MVTALPFFSLITIFKTILWQKKNTFDSKRDVNLIFLLQGEIIRHIFCITFDE